MALVRYLAVLPSLQVSLPAGPDADNRPGIKSIREGGANGRPVAGSWMMDRMTQARLEARARILRALAHPTRLFMVEELSRGERCVFELTEMIGADMSTVSKHLGVLKAAGIVTDEKRRVQVYYRLKTPCVMRFFDCVSEVMENTANEYMALACKARASE